MSKKEIEGYNPNDLPTFHYSEFHDFQGDLKTITRERLNKLKESLQEHGLFTAKKAFLDDDGEPWLLDGHQTTCRALKELDEDGWSVPEVPTEIVKVEDEEDAARKLLQINSKYGQMNERTEFFDKMGIDEDEFTDFEINMPDTDQLDFNMDDVGAEGREQSTEETQEDYKEKQTPDRETKFDCERGDLYKLGQSYLFCGDIFEFEEIRTYCEDKIDFNFDNIDLLFYDPPYQQDYTYQKRMLLASLPYIRDTIVMFGSSQVLSRFYAEFHLNKNEKYNINYRHDLVWDRVNPHLGPSMQRPLMYHVPINIYSSNGNNVFNRHNSAVDDVFNGLDRIPSVMRIPDQKKLDDLLGRGAKPVDLLRVLFATYCTNRILDCGVGNGTSFIAGEMEDRAVFGIERDTNMCEIALEYYKRETGNQPKEING